MLKAKVVSTDSGLSRDPAPPSLEGDTFRALRLPDFRLFWGGAFVSNIGTWLQTVAQGWLVLSLTSSPAWLGAIAFLGNLPSILLTPIGGVYADRLDRRRVLIVLQSLMLIAAGLLGVLTHLQRVQPWHIAVLSLLSGCALALNGPFFSSSIKDLATDYKVEVARHKSNA